jgi:hypothetical protein
MSYLNYSTYVTNLANFFPISPTDPNYLTFIPDNISYAENRIYRELDLLHTQVTDASTQVSSGNRNFSMPTSVGTFITVDELNVITPAATPSSVGSRVQLTRVAPEVVDAVYPSNRTFPGVPRFYAMRSDTQAILGPAPDKPYFAEVIGIQRPAPLSVANSSTVLTQYVPDLFLAAAMVHASGYMKDFGSQSDNPQMAQSWEAQYNILFKSAAVEQARAKFQAEGWTSEQPSPVASPPRV